MGKRKKKIRFKKCHACKNNVCKTCKGTGQLRIVKGRTKGATFERHIAKEVSRWCGIEFRRTPQSGGWAKTGDITPKNPKHMVKFPFNLELKNQEVLDFGHIFQVPKNKKTPIRKWWNQAHNDAKKSGDKIPVLVFTKAREQVYCMMRTQTFDKLLIADFAQVVVHLPKHRVCLWEDFLKTPYHLMVSRLKGTLK